ncbi:hypothetical protein MYCTH_89343 [Thermothelomyces thermophilus ATCC 42464]|uniref:Uncharacterized protein n=1 Tax=Thermothelomyces thermophilus (strain ATCC 42464 / BCRC 31852 / DSM 1799) TaxID=573729 RepID=G2PZI4_THET4|nr:uncharacterized protein MYCTH_89343 [Thermothelomyces thermophilus ATCC 42464]AEO55670.1 hypothetical protein MYCTH_89343 [Thermothelomyces thermophilus ATCC 42464]
MLALHAHTRLLIQLHATLYWTPESGLLRGQKLAPVVFAADVAAVATNEDDNDYDFDYECAYGYGSATGSAVDVFLRSVDASCLDRVRAMTRATAFRFDEPVHYEAERAFVWAGVGGGDGGGGGGGGSIPIRGLSAAELGRQVDMVRRRGYRDWVKVEMAVEISAGEELRRKGSEAGWAVGGLWDKWEGTGRVE